MFVAYRVNTLQLRTMGGGGEEYNLSINRVIVRSAFATFTQIICSLLQGCQKVPVTGDIASYLEVFAG